MSHKPYGRFEQLRPDELERIMSARPVVYWPLGLIEHHGWHLPVGFDGVKAERFCLRMAERTGGLVLPVMWWGGLGGHGGHKWTFYQQPDASRAILFDTLEKCVAFGARAIVLLAGHYPWEQLLADGFLQFTHRHPGVLALLGTEVTIASPPLDLPPGDHAARQETAYGLFLLPELIDLSALRDGRDLSAWPGGAPPEPAALFPGVEADPSKALYAQLGEDPRRAAAEEGRRNGERIIDSVVERVNGFLEGRGTSR
jgi:creatinine amidohydrolase